MAFDFKKVLDFLSPSYAQLKGLLIASVGTIGMVYFIGVKTADFQRNAKEANELTKKTYELTIQNTNALDQMKIDNKADMAKLYNDILDMNTRNSTYLNSKFSLLINYGNSNKGLLLDMIKSLDEQQKLYEQDRLKNMEYWNSIKPPLAKPDTLNPSIRVNKVEPKNESNVIIESTDPKTKPGTVKK